MSLLETQLTANEVLRAFHHDEPYLFLGAAFTAIALVAVAFCIMRRRFDALLIFLAIFALLYGQRLWFDADILRITLPDNSFFQNLHAVVNYLVPIPALLYFLAAGYLGRHGKAVVIPLTAIFLGLAAATVIFGYHHAFDITNNIVVIVALPGIALRLHLMRNRHRDFLAIRIGLLSFVATSLWDNVIGGFVHPAKIEPYGFAVFLASLGYVAARRVLNRDHELTEIRSELDLARRIQFSILPQHFPANHSFTVEARYVPMTSVAGDLYDFLVTGDEQAGLLIADVSGHGVPAALIASMVKMAATAQRAHAANPAALLSAMNDALLGNTQDQFVTAAYVHLDAALGEFHYAAAGHPPMLLLRNGHVSEIVENGFILGITSHQTFTNAVHRLEPGDRLILYTDGLLEARNKTRELFGENSLHKVVRETKALPATEAADRIIASVEAWSQSQDDDLTLLICDFRPAA